MSGWEQRSIYDEPGVGTPPPVARLTDPESSHLTLDSLGKDTSYNWRIFEALVHLSRREELRRYDDGESIAVIYDRPVTDDQLVTWLEEHYQRRFERNVVARQRGILRDAGWVKRVDDVVGRTGRKTIAHVPTDVGMRAWSPTSR